MTIAKALGGGIPIGACLATEKAASALTAGSHGSTFGGNPLSMAVGNAVLDVMQEEGFLEGVERLAARLNSEIEQVIARHGDVFDHVRGLGLMMGIKSVAPVGDVINAMRDHHVLAVPAGDNVMRFLPPLVINDSHIAEAVAALEAVGQELGS